MGKYHSIQFSWLTLAMDNENFPIYFFWGGGGGDFCFILTSLFHGFNTLEDNWRSRLLLNPELRRKINTKRRNWGKKNKDRVKFFSKLLD